MSVTCCLEPRPSSRAGRLRGSDVHIRRRWPRSWSCWRVSVWECPVPLVRVAGPSGDRDIADVEPIATTWTIRAVSGGRTAPAGHRSYNCGPGCTPNRSKQRDVNERLDLDRAASLLDVVWPGKVRVGGQVLDRAAHPSLGREIRATPGTVHREQASAARSHSSRDPGTNIDSRCAVSRATRAAVSAGSKYAFCVPEPMISAFGPTETLRRCCQ